MLQPRPGKNKTIASLSRSLRAKIRLSGLALTLEQLAAVFWPALTIFLATLGLLIWQVHSILPYALAIGLYAVLVGAAVAFLIKGARRYIPAKQNQAIMRLDASGDGSPVATLVDRQFLGSKDEGSQELWQLHQLRMAKEAARVEVRAPHVRLAKRDPWALRLVVVLFFGSAIFFGRANTKQTLFETLQDLASGTAGETVSFEAWAEPPAYTGQPSIYLNTLLEKNAVLDLPQGTQLILRSYGTSELEIVSDVATLNEAQTKLADESSFKVTQSGSLALKKGFRTVASWDIRMILDLPPRVKLTGDVSRTIQGSLQIPYAAQDDYGIIGGTVEIALDVDALDRRFGLIADPESTELIRFDLPVPFNADTKDYKETLVEDLAKHPWAGLPVKITLSVVDDAGNMAAIEPVFTAMPGKRFFDTLAAALAEQRRDILWNRGNVDRADMILKTLTYLPDEGFQNKRAYLLVRSVIRRVGYTKTRPIDDEMQSDVSESLWRAALLIEDGDLSDAAARLKRAQERLSKAMTNGATKDEIAQLMDELRQATDEYMRQLAENAQPQDQQADNQNRQEISPDILQEMMDKIQELMEQGRMDEAQALLDQLQQMMQNMRVTKGGKNQSGEGQERAEGLQDTLRQQQELADENFQQMQEEFSRNQQRQNQGDQQGQDPQEEGQNEGTQGKDDEPQHGSGQGELADRQEALRQLMEQQLGQLGDDGSEAGQAARDALEQAEREMGEARDNLKEGRGSEALDNQADAVEALRQGMRQLNEANRQAQRGQGREGQQNGETVGPNGEDPLGRSTAKRGTVPTNENLLSDAQLRRSKEILEEIRRRAGERTRPQLELDYLDRLLDRF